MKTYLSAFDLWYVVENENEPPQLPTNPTATQLKNYSEERQRDTKPKVVLSHPILMEFSLESWHVRLQSKLET